MPGESKPPSPPDHPADRPAKAPAPGGLARPGGVLSQAPDEHTLDVDPARAAEQAAAQRAPSRANAIYLDSPDPSAARPAGPPAPAGPTGVALASEAPGPGPGGLRRCGEYELIEEIGRGGMGRVYLARSRKLNRLVALKMLLAGPGAGLDQIRRLMVEAKTMAALEHPNVVRVFDVGVEGDIHYFTMEYIDGPSLSQVMHRLKTGGGSSSSLPDVIENLRKRKGSSANSLEARAVANTPGSAGAPGGDRAARLDRAAAGNRAESAGAASPAGSAGSAEGPDGSGGSDGPAGAVQSERSEVSAGDAPGMAGSAQLPDLSRPAAGAASIQAPGAAPSAATQAPAAATPPP
ncbi:MAG: protein kinase domain-containing protein, partial [Planctomycetota bacterium]